MITNEEFIRRAADIHNSKYDYSKVVYVKHNIPIEIFCPIHGAFLQKPVHHLQGKSCQLCAGRVRSNKEDFIKKSIQMHGLKYDYSQVLYTNNKDKVHIICPEHGSFYQGAKQHYKGNGCKQCSHNKLREDFAMNINEFINRANEVHSNFYKYDAVDYINSLTKVDIICPKHGLFTQRPKSHLNGHGCRICKESKGEREIAKFLTSINISFERQKKFDDCKLKSHLYFDFYLPDYNMCIEYDGRQHFESDDFFGGESGFIVIKERDGAKNLFCFKDNINLLRIKYNERIEEKLLTALQLSINFK